TIVASGCNHPADSAEKRPVDYVNPYMGNISHLLVPTYPTVHLPNSFLRVYPERNDFTGDRLKGLPLVVTSHRGSSAFNLSPFQGSTENLEPVVSYSYDQEEIKPYAYSVYLDEQQVEVDFAPSHQSAMYQLDFEEDDPVYLAVNSRNGSLQWDGKALSGHQDIGNGTKVYIYMVPEQTPVRTAVLKDKTLSDGTTADGRNACLVLLYAKGPKQLDRKSTRLNSSHVKNSYAVFCLKKTIHIAICKGFD